jgi:hypothetical protein
MTHEEPESGEEQIDESGRNPTQQDIDEHGAEDVPVDVPWPEGGRS